ncbi:MAG: hypothetical protein ACK55I_05590, partial [bacterium]
HVLLLFGIDLRHQLRVGQHDDAVQRVFLDDAGTEHLRPLLVGHLAVDHGRGLAPEVADGEPQVALHGLPPLGIGRGVGAELQIDRVAAGIHELRRVGAVHPRAVILHLPADVEMGIVAG